ncbi:hypothetical protein S83_060314, partial [Arachis hypogaea]
ELKERIPKSSNCFSLWIRSTPSHQRFRGKRCVLKYLIFQAYRLLFLFAQFNSKGK